MLRRLNQLWEAARARLAARGHTLTQRQLSKQAGVAPQTLSNWLAGRSPRNLDELTAVGAKLAEWGGVEAPTAEQWSQFVEADRVASASATEDAGPAMTGLPAPYPSSTFLARPKVEEPAVHALIAEPHGDQGGIVALVGMSGTGKTSSAIQIVADRRVRQRFPDGIWWLDVRRTPTLFYLDRSGAVIGRSSGAPRPEELTALVDARVRSDR